MEFDSHKVVVKEHGTDGILCEGKEQGGLYRLLVQLALTANLGEAISAQIWHNLLGHLHGKVVISLINKDHIHNRNKVFLDCVLV